MRVDRHLTLPDLLARRAAEQAEKTAIVVADVGEITFGDWDRRADATARSLVERGLSPGDRVALVFGERDWIDYAVAWCGVLRAGGVAVPLSERLAPAEIDHAMADCGVVQTISKETSAELAANDTAPMGRGLGPEKLAQIIYTSGTTGRAKGVGATHANLAFGTDPRHRRLAHSRHFLHAFPIGTNAGQNMLVNALDAHPAALTTPMFTPGRFARLIETHRVGTVFVVPSHAIQLLNAGVHERHDFSSVRLLGSTAANLPPCVAAGMAKAFPNATIVNYYTSTEAAPAHTVMIVDPARPASVGRPTQGGDLRISGPDGETVKPGETGEIWLRSPAGSRVYYGDRQATDRVFRDGWVRMGDLGYLDDDGYLYLVDREGDVIESGGHKVSTLQVEAALHEHPSVAEAAVAGLPHPVLGRVTGAAVVTRAPVTPAGLRAFLLDRLAPHELPSRLVFVAELPKNHLGKVVKPRLLDLIGPAHTPPGRTR
ncbi:long-chain fatty acid--CoA ligase [Herbidospora galbida]|uniref:Long-chain fatty acid--CoA ligase n=1 Tax=Herbidospora galbida TaxID=2575442 RepID=A0A4U3MHA9_9ACTN|nr:AMP-binding protein [Herbidospora galbida]TKK87744.1 long-chain fatty acid--CoA ligase [Herbidospora galbida]